MFTRALIPSILRLSLVMRAVCWLGILCSTATAQAETFYFMLIFGSQSQPPKAKYVHTYATLVKATGTGNDWNNYQLDVHTISWLPETMDIKVGRLTPEKGHNFTLHQTNAWALRYNSRIECWGPYQICGTMYQRGLNRVHQLRTHQKEYQAIDPIISSDIMNCIHAVSGLDPIHGRLRYPLIRVGSSASRHIAEVFDEHELFLNVEANHSWLLHRLGLNCNEIKSADIQHRILSGGIGFRPLVDREDELTSPNYCPSPDLIIPAGTQYTRKQAKSPQIVHKALEQTTIR